MTVEIALFICVMAAFACYLVWKWQIVAVPPYQEPIKYEQDEGALTPAQIEDINDSLKLTAINPQAAWPFPAGSKP
jgi:hypothetical protein